MTRLLVVEPSYCPYQAGFSSAATAVSEVIEGESQILKPFGTPRIGLIWIAVDLTVPVTTLTYKRIPAYWTVL